MEVSDSFGRFVRDADSFQILFDHEPGLLSFEGWKESVGLLHAA
jgi:hypothetical protein